MAAAQCGYWCAAMPRERQIQALNMSPRGVSVDDSNVLSSSSHRQSKHHVGAGHNDCIVPSLPSSTTCQPSYFSRVINQNNLDFPVTTCSFECSAAGGPIGSCSHNCNQTVSSVSSAVARGSSLSRKRSFNQRYHATSLSVLQSQPNHASNYENSAAAAGAQNMTSLAGYNAPLELDIPTNLSADGGHAPMASSSIPCSPHNWTTAAAAASVDVSSNSHQHCQIFSIDDMGTLRGGGHHNAYDFCNNMSHNGSNGMARSVSFGAETFPPIDPNFSHYITPNYHTPPNTETKRSSFQHNQPVHATINYDQFSDSSGFSSLVYSTPGLHSPASERLLHVDQLNTSQFGSDVSNVESVFSDVASYSQFSDSHSMDVESLKSPRDSYGANEELRTSFSSGSQCSESVQRIDASFFDAPGQPNPDGSHIDASQRANFYLFGDDSAGRGSLNMYNHMDLAVGHGSVGQIAMSTSSSTTSSHPQHYHTGVALNALNLDGGVLNDMIDFDSILEDLDSFYRPPHQQNSVVDQCDQKLDDCIKESPSVSVIPTYPPLQMSSNNGTASSMGRSCSLENILDDLNKTVGGSQSNILDFLNLDSVMSDSNQESSDSTSFENTPKRTQNLPPAEQSQQPFLDGSVSSTAVSQQPSASHTILCSPFKMPISMNSPNAAVASVSVNAPHHRQNSLPPHCHSQMNQRSMSGGGGPQADIPRRHSYIVTNSNNSNSNASQFYRQPTVSDIVSKSPKHKRWKLSMIDRASLSRSPSLEDISVGAQSYHHMMFDHVNPVNCVKAAPSPLLSMAQPHNVPSHVTSNMASNNALSHMPQRGPPGGMTVVSSRRSRKSKAITNPRMRSASNPSSAIIFSDDEELFGDESYGPSITINSRRSNSDASKSIKQQSIDSEMRYNYLINNHQDNFESYEGGVGKKEYSDFSRSSPEMLAQSLAAVNATPPQHSQPTSHPKQQQQSQLTSNHQTAAQQPININISVINVITSDGENVVPVSLSSVTSNVLSSVVAGQKETATRIAKLFQEKQRVQTSLSNGAQTTTSSNSGPTSNTTPSNLSNNNNSINNTNSYTTDNTNAGSSCGNIQQQQLMNSCHNLSLSGPMFTSYQQQQQQFSSLSNSFSSSSTLTESIVNTQDSILDDHDYLPVTTFI